MLSDVPDVLKPIQQANLNNDIKIDEFGPNFKVILINDQIRELQTVIRDRNTSRSDFVFYADRLIRLVVEEGLNQLPYKRCTITTPTGGIYEGLKYLKGNCGVSIVRSGEAMEQGLRDCCRSIRIGKILIQSDEDTHEAHVVYAKFPEDVALRKVLLMYPIMSTGNTVIKSVKVLKEHGVREDNIILLNLFCTPHAATSVMKAYPAMTILTSEVHPVAPNHFGQKYFDPNGDNRTKRTTKQQLVLHFHQAIVNAKVGTNTRVRGDCVQAFVFCRYEVPVKRV